MSKISLEAGVGNWMILLEEGVDMMLLTMAAPFAVVDGVVLGVVVPGPISDSDISSGIIISHEVCVS